jgi:hypothetical protein
MRIVAVYDPDGTIRSLMTAPRDGLYGGLPLAPGERLGTFDVPDLPDVLDPQEMNTRLKEIARSQKVDTRDPRLRLVPNDSDDRA